METVTSDHCRRHRDLNVTSTVGGGGFIASIVTSDTPSCDGISHPWVISGFSGQRVDLTLYDFGLEDKERESYVYQQQQQRSKSPEPGLEVCRQYGIIQDSGRDKTTTLCGSDRRVSTPFRSTGNTVKLWVTAGSSPRDTKRFIIQYHST